MLAIYSTSKDVFGYQKGLQTCKHIISFILVYISCANGLPAALAPSVLGTVCSHCALRETSEGTPSNPTIYNLLTHAPLVCPCFKVLG